jgi:hypothetical protein
MRPFQLCKTAISKVVALALAGAFLLFPFACCILRHETLTRIHIVDHDVITVNSVSMPLKIKSVYPVLEKKWKQGVRSVVISGGEAQTHDTFRRVFESCAVFGMLNYFLEIDGQPVEFWLGPVIARPYFWVVANVNSDPERIFVRRSEVVISGTTVTESDQIDAALRKLTNDGQKPLEIACEGSSSHRTLLAVVKAYHEIGGKHAFILTYQCDPNNEDALPKQ